MRAELTVGRARPCITPRMNAFEFLLQWYQNHCDGDWEHQYGVRINTIDNPGWQVQIDLAETEMEEMALDYRLIENSETDWVGCSITNKVFVGAGDPAKLGTILGVFKEMAEKV